MKHDCRESVDPSMPGPWDYPERISVEQGFEPQLAQDSGGMHEPDDSGKRKECTYHRRDQTTLWGSRVGEYTGGAGWWAKHPGADGTEKPGTALTPGDGINRWMSRRTPRAGRTDSTAAT